MNCSFAAIFFLIFFQLKNIINVGIFINQSWSIGDWRAGYDGRNMYEWAIEED